jgi:hypothetical protein
MEGLVVRDRDVAEKVIGIPTRAPGNHVDRADRSGGEGARERS